DLVIQRERGPAQERGIHLTGEQYLPAGALRERARQDVRLAVRDRDGGADDRARDALGILGQLVELARDRDQMIEAAPAQQEHEEPEDALVELGPELLLEKGFLLVPPDVRRLEESPDPRIALEDARDRFQILVRP